MTQLAAAGYPSAATRSEGDMKQFFEDVLAFMKQLPGGAAETILTLSGDRATATGAFHQIDTESAAAADDLTNLLQDNVPDGSVVFLRNVTASRIVTVKHAAGGAGQFLLASDADVRLRDPALWMAVKRTGTAWEEVLRHPALYFDTLAREYGYVLQSDTSKPDGLDRVLYEPWIGGRFDYSSATQVKFAPVTGNLLPVPNSSSYWTVRNIGNGVLSANPTTASNYVSGVPNQQLAPSTVYLVAIFDNAGTLTFDFWPVATGHSLDATWGMHVITGQPLRVLVGMVKTNASRQFVDSEAQRLVLSYYNRRPKPIQKQMHSANVSTASGSLVELNGSGSRADFLCWADGMGIIWTQGSVYNDTAGGHTIIVVRINGAVPPGGDRGVDFNSSTSLQTGPVFTQLPLGAVISTDGYNYASPWGRTAGVGTSFFLGGSGDSGIYTLGYVLG